MLSGEGERGNREIKAFVALLCLTVQWWDPAGNRGSFGKETRFERKNRKSHSGK